jgi:hypothetical protein
VDEITSTLIMETVCSSEKGVAYMSLKRHIAQKASIETILESCKQGNELSNTQICEEIFKYLSFSRTPLLHGIR